MGVWLSIRIGCPPAPPLNDRAGWRRVLVWGLGIGFAFGVYDAAIGALTHVRSEAIDRGHGFTSVNIALPWSLAHYFHAAVTLECAFRLGFIVISAWFVGRLILKGRAETLVFWVFAVLAAWIEPLMHALYSKKLLFAGMDPLDTALNLSSIAEQIVFAWMLRRFGWPAPILMRFAWYLIVRVFVGYLYPHTSEMYPGPH